MLLMRPTGMWSMRHARQPHTSHQSLKPFAVDLMVLALEKDGYFPAAVERVTAVFLVNLVV